MIATSSIAVESLQHAATTETAISPCICYSKFAIPSNFTTSSYEIVPLSLPSGSTMQWSARQGLLCLALLAELLSGA